MTGEHFIKALEEAIEQKKAVCSSYDSVLILTRETAEGIIEAYKSQKAEFERLKSEITNMCREMLRIAIMTVKTDRKEMEGESK